MWKVYAYEYLKRSTINPRSCRTVLRRHLSTTQPILDTEILSYRLNHVGPSIAASLSSQGYWRNGDIPLLQDDEIRAMRQQSIDLRNQGRFEQSWSERINEEGIPNRFDKEGVFACEPDGRDYDTAPDLLLYMSTLISSLPLILNEHVNAIQEETTQPQLHLSNQAFNAKLAVTSPGGSTYPLHVDNTLGIKGIPTDDSRKLTCILYLNPDYEPTDGGQLRLLLLNKECIDVDPVGMVIFWSDEIPHEVLACKPESSDSKFDRYALTIWLPDNDPRNIQPSGSKFEALRSAVFGGETWC